jgi:hypothetical protein
VRDGADSDAPGELCCLLQRCARLRKVVLQGCGSTGLPAMMALVSKRGMQEVELGGVEDAQQHEALLQRVARQLGVELTVEALWSKSVCAMYSVAPIC